ncbi:hypothetical protein VTP01DRAFT_1608 [Rhizomucor pusillus]|uniref:uncharacterized protein n=1 Tax=Rhizomucor pusillus TaxID=4840 RepID=UPI0037449C12
MRRILDAPNGSFDPPGDTSLLGCISEQLKSSCHRKLSIFRKTFQTGSTSAIPLVKAALMLRVALSSSYSYDMELEFQCIAVAEGVTRYTIISLVQYCICRQQRIHASQLHKNNLK